MTQLTYMQLLAGFVSGDYKAAGYTLYDFQKHLESHFEKYQGQIGSPMGYSLIMGLDPRNEKVFINALGVVLRLEHELRK